MPDTQIAHRCPYTQHQMFDLIADVESYPQFVPLWKDARIYRRKAAGTYYTDQELGLGWWRVRFRTKTMLERPTRICVSSIDKAFQDLDIVWTFEPTPDGGCVVACAQHTPNESAVLRALTAVALRESAELTVRAFERRARKLFTGLPICMATG